VDIGKGVEWSGGGGTRLFIKVAQAVHLLLWWEHQPAAELNRGKSKEK